MADHLRFRRVFLVGHSLGASVTACCAGRFHPRLLGLVLVDFGGDPRDDGPDRLSALVHGLAPANFQDFAREAMATCLRDARPGVIAQVLGDLAATPRASFAGAVLGLLDFDPILALAGKHVRTLHVHAPFLEAMGLVPIHQRVQGMPSQRVADCSHWVHLTPDQWSTAFTGLVFSPCGYGRFPDLDGV